MRAFWTILLVLHAGLHLLGFFAWSGLLEVPALNGPVLFPLSAAGEGVFASLWLFACVVFSAAALLRALEHPLFAKVSLFGVVLSQGLIVVAWHDAKAGTLANLLIGAAAVTGMAHLRFLQRVNAEVEAMYARSLPSGRVQPVLHRLTSLPAPVRDWLEASGAASRAGVTSLRLRQRGGLRTGPNAPLMPARAEQYVTLDEPAFIWRVETVMLHLLPIQGRDKYDMRGGEMLIKAASLVNLVRAADDKIADAALLRFLAEMIWYPQAALRPYITWSAVDATNARATLRHVGREVSALFTFDARGRVTCVRAERPMGVGDEAKLTPWGGRCSSWRVVDGVEIPVCGEVYWTLPEGDFVYYEWEIYEVEYEARTLYGAREAVTRRVVPRSIPRPSGA